jgi:anhydro-N-acetylmuramic acid kinase
MGASQVRLIVGCMTGTSLDGLDAALVEVTGEGLGIQARLIGMVSRALGGLADVLEPMAEGKPRAPLDYLLAARQLGELHADAVEDLCRQHLQAGVPLCMIVAHGQTVWHAPQEGVSWQLFDPQPLVRRLGVPVCYDLRQADLIAGGEGAPITPISDWVMYRHPKRDRLIVNLGGISNVTHLPADGTPEQVTGADVGPCNLLIDGVVRQLFPDRRIDTDGQIARTGRINLEVYGLVQKHPAISGKTKRSTGREDFTDGWVRGLVDRLKDTLSPADLVAGAVEAVAQLLGRTPFTANGDVVLAGGGARNPVLVQRLRAVMKGREVILSDELGFPVDARESAGFALLGALCQDGVPITLPQITGATAPAVAGHWVFPGVYKR